MKKLNIIFTLIISSFFLFSVNKVKADTLTWNLDLSFDSYINENTEFLINTAEEVIKGNEYKYYLVFFINDNFSYIYFFNDYTGVFTPSGNGLYGSELLSTPLYYKVFSDKSITQLYNSSFSIGLSSIGYKFIYTNFSFIYNGENDYILNTSNCSYSLKNGEKIRGLYEYYLSDQDSCSLNSVEQPDIHLKEKETLLNFYNMVFEKISFLSDTFAENYILLTSFGVFIFMFVFYLIRRFLL